MECNKHFTLLIVFLLFCLGCAVAQDTYRPKGVYDNYSTGLVESIKAEGKKYADPLPKNHGVIKEVIEASVDWHVELVSKGMFIRDSKLEGYLNGIVNNLVGASGTAKPFKILIAKNPSINAFCTPIGSLIINNGLLSRLNSEEQLTFVLAHEIAHWELEHIKRQIINEINADGGKDAKKEVKKLTSGRISVQGIREIRKFMEEVSQFSREMELEADSMALVMFSKLKYSPDQALGTMDMLDSNYLYTPYYGSKLFKVLDFEKYPFNTDWVTDDSNREYRMGTGKGSGPLSTHPELPYRKERLANLIGNSQGEYTHKNNLTYEKVKKEAALEDITCAYEIDYYLDQALYYALRLYIQNPGNSYVNGMIGKILYRVGKLKQSGLFLIRSNIDRKNKELYYTNTFLNNISITESLDLAYYFMNQKGNFDRDNEDHYMLLYDICGSTSRYKMQDVVKNGYRAKFSKGKYLLRMY